MTIGNVVMYILFKVPVCVYIPYDCRHSTSDVDSWLPCIINADYN